MLKPVAFRVWDFRSIRDSGICSFSGDNITVLAGQNEAGKSALLYALRDFDLPSGNEPETPDYRPEDVDGAETNPCVSVKFEVDVPSLKSSLEKASKTLPDAVYKFIEESRHVWVTRDLDSGLYYFEDSLSALWATVANFDYKLVASVDEETDDTAIFMPESEFIEWLRLRWPVFVYYDAFTDSLPRTVQLDDLIVRNKAEENTTSTAASSATSTVNKDVPNIPQTVLDFVDLADISLDRVNALKDNDKGLRNYLITRIAFITGDFLNYWHQKTDGLESVKLVVESQFDSSGKLNLHFYVQDKSLQYPDQRSKGFL